MIGRIVHSEDFIILCQVNKALPRVEQELEDLIADWERLHQVSNTQTPNCWTFGSEVSPSHSPFEKVKTAVHPDIYFHPDPVPRGRSVPEGLHRDSEAGARAAARGGEARQREAEEGDSASGDQVQRLWTAFLEKDSSTFETLRYGAKPSTPARLKGHNSTAKVAHYSAAMSLVQKFWTNMLFFPCTLYTV